jgi:hypothetical protein
MHKKPVSRVNAERGKIIEKACLGMKYGNHTPDYHHFCGGSIRQSGSGKLLLAPAANDRFPITVHKAWASAS